MHNIAINDEVTQILKSLGIEYYTCWERTTGCGKTSGLHLGTNVWLVMNPVIFIALENNKKDKLIEKIKETRKKLGKESIKAYVLPLEEVI